MTESAKLRIPYIAASQAQKHVTHNEALTLLDTLVQASVIDKDLSAPPVSPSEGDCYIVAATGTGDWAGWDNRIARFIDGEWRSYLPGAGDGEGWLVYVQDEDALYVFTGSAWQPFAFSGGKGADVASAATLSLGAGGYFHITGTTTITDIDFAAPANGRWAWVIFDGALTLTHNGTTLILPGGADIATAAGDRALFIQDASDNVICLAYVRAGGKPVGATGTLVDNRVMRADGAGGNVQGSLVTIDDSGNITIGGTNALSGRTLTIDGTNSAATQPCLGFYDPSGASGKKAMGFVFDGAHLLTEAAIVIQDLQDNGAFTANLIAFWNNAGISVGSVTDPGAGVVKVHTTTDASALDTGTLRTLGGASISKKLYVGDLINVAGTVVVDANGHLGLRSYTVATLPSAAAAARMIYVSDEAGGATPAFSDGTNWRRVSDRAIVS
jgi:hypothetical protein